MCVCVCMSTHACLIFIYIKGKIRYNYQEILNILKLVNVELKTGNNMYMAALFINFFVKYVYCSFSKFDHNTE